MPRAHLTATQWEHPFQAVYDFARDVSIFTATYLNPPDQPPAASVPHGDGRKVVVMPGMLAADFTTDRLVGWLKSIGYDAFGWGGGVNWGPTPAILARIDALIDTAHAESGRPVSLVARSISGIYAREYAKRHPERVDRIITMGSPVRLPVKTPLSPFERVLALYYDPSIADHLDDMRQNPPVPVTAMYSKCDGLVSWQSCVVDEGPLAENFELDCTHMVMAENTRALRIVATRLADKPFIEPLTKA